MPYGESVPWPHQQPAFCLRPSRRALLRTAAAIGAGELLGSRFLAAATGDTVPSAVATVAEGRLQGELLPGGLRVFRGVPFAAPPVGPLRFRPPSPAMPWSGVRNGTHFAAEAMQQAEPGVARSEDCLYLNIWTPPGAGPFPVFVWIHGGGYTGGRSSAPIFDGARFARDGIVCVTVAYRLGVFGFLDLGPLLGADFDGSGNNGTRDLVAGLRWVERNIASFGGDPGRVTVGGESAGAKATAALMALPEARPLFQSAISESGGGERVLTLDQATEVAHSFAAEWQRGAAAGMAADLRTAPAAELIAAQERLIPKTALHFPFRAEVDGHYLAKRPVDLVAEGSARGKRLLIGSNRDESALFIGAHPVADPTARDLGNLSLARFDEVFRQYATLYPGMSAPQRRVRAVTAEEYWVPTVRLAEAHVRAGGSAWVYRLDLTENNGRLAGEAYHTLDLGLVWDQVSPENAGVDQALASQVHAGWCAFIRGEEPAAPGLPAWPRYRAEDRPTMLLDRMSRVELRPAETELQLWDGVL